MAMRPCARAGCGNVVVKGHCDGCKPRSPAVVKERWRGSSWQRGYDAAWLRFRAWFLGRHPACNDCGRLATEVHHVKKVRDSPELRLVESNCMALCHEDHSKRTARGE
jgi:5-methylcytosine-specific restriction protein A